MHLLAKPLRLMINQIYTYLSSITHRGDPRTDDIRPRDDETFLTSSQGRLHDDCRFQVKKNIKIPSNSFIHVCFIYWQQRFHFLSSEVCGTDPPLSCPIHVFDGQDDVKHNLEGIIFVCLFNNKLKCNNN